MLPLLLFLAVGVPIYSVSNEHPKQGRMSFMKNLVELPMVTDDDIAKAEEKLSENATLLDTEMRNVVPDTIPQNLTRFFNQTAINVIKEKRNRNSTETEDALLDDDEEIDEDLNRPVFDGDKTTIKITTDAGAQLHQHWIDQAVSGLMAAVATTKLEKMSPEEHVAHKKCTKTSKNVADHARCVLKLIKASKTKATKKRKTVRKTTSSTTSTTTTTTTEVPSTTTKQKFLVPKRIKSTENGYKLRKKSKKSKSKSSQRYSNSSGDSSSQNTSRRKYRKKSKSGPKRLKFAPDSRMVNGSKKQVRRLKYDVPKRMKRAIEGRKLKKITKESYELIDPYGHSPLSIISKSIKGVVRDIKHDIFPQWKTKKDKSWQNTLDDIQKEGDAQRQKEKVERTMKKRFEMFSKAGKNLRDGKDPMEDMSLDYVEKPKTPYEEIMEERKEVEKNLTPEQKMIREPVKLIREGVKLAMQVSGRDVTRFDNKTLRIFSPKLFSIVDEDPAAKNETINFLSPDLLSLHEGSDNNTLSVSSMLKNTGAHEGVDDIMDMIFETSLVSEYLDMMKEKQKKKEREERLAQLKGMNTTSEPMSRENATKIYGEVKMKRIDHFKRFMDMTPTEELDHTDRKGWTTMTREQLEFFYGKGSPFEDMELLNKYMNRTRRHTERSIEHTIEQLAKQQIEFKHGRQKDLVLSPVVFSPIINAPEVASQALILSPAFMSPIILSPAIFGNVILSPWAFVPVIVSPRVLGSVILSPILFSPVILSPLALNPVILSPGLGLPLILSPFVLTPFILSPVALTPLILSPFALSPFIAVPNALSPMILSPFVLSPLILSPPAFSAFVLNPYALSPIIKSDGAFFTAVLSPSWLS